MARRALAVVEDIAKPGARANAGLASDVADALAALQVPDLPAPAGHLLRSIVERADQVGTGVPVSVAARLLAVSERTVRTWVDRGVLEVVPAARPVLIRPRSLGEAMGIAKSIRELVSSEPRLLHYLSDLAELDELRKRVAELEDREEFEPGRVEEQLFS